MPRKKQRVKKGQPTPAPDVHYTLSFEEEHEFKTIAMADVMRDL